MAEFRIDELAQASGVSVRNIRAYQDGGILPSPLRRGRIGVYDDDHLGRLRLIAGLLQRGYTIANIAELIKAWERGRELSSVLGLEQVVTGITAGPPVAFLERSELVDALRAGDDTSSVVRSAIDAGLVRPEGDRFRITDTRQWHAVTDLVRAGVPVAEVIELLAGLRNAVSGPLREFIAALAGGILASKPDGWMPAGPEISGLTDYIRTVQRCVEHAVAAVATASLGERLDVTFGEYIERVMPNPDCDAN